MKLQNINYENMILIYHICRYIILPLFTSYRKSEICFIYLIMLSRMKAAYIFSIASKKCAQRQCGGP